MFPLKWTSQRSITWCEHTPSRKQREKKIQKNRVKSMKSAMRNKINAENKKVGY